jgi:EmrB/QacA subfamily drug resistance transporter
MNLASPTRVLAAAIMASSMVFIDSTAVNVVLPILQRELHATIVEAQWFVEAYALFLSALILVGGSLGDHFGRVRLFLIGVIGFAIASALCGLARDAGQLIAARSVQGIASAILTPGSLSILGATFDDKQRGKAIGLWSSFSAITGAAGPVLGGVIAEHASWRWIFFMNVPFAIATVAAMIGCPESRVKETVHHVDWAGAALATLGLGSIVYALISATGPSGWVPAYVLLLVAGFVLLAVFIAVEARVPSPMMPLELFSNRAFSAVNLMTLLQYAALGGALFFLPFNLILVQHYTPTAAGAAFLPAIGLIFALSPWAGTLCAKIGPKILLVGGTLVSAVAFVLLAVPTIGGSYWTTYFPGTFALGLGMGFVVTPLTTTVMGSVDSDHFGVASGINNAIARTAGLIAIAAFSLAVVATFNRTLETRLATISAPPQITSAIDAERSRLAAATPPASTPNALRNGLEYAIARSYVSGFRVAMLLAALLSLGSALCAALELGGAQVVSERGPRSP